MRRPANRRKFGRFCFGVVALVATPTLAADFASGPTATRNDQGVAIDFTVDEPTDVAVSIVDAKGHVVRHLAAGQLGKNAPTPLHADSLKQSLVWDGRDDLGKPIDVPVRVRVGLGLRPKPAGTAFGPGAAPDTITNVIGLATGQDGEIFVMSRRWKSIWWRQTSIHVFGRDGKYRRTIKPFDPNLGRDGVRALTDFQSSNGLPLPIIYRVLAMSYYPNEDIPQQMAVTPDGHLQFLVSRAAYRKGPEKFLATLASDGGLPHDSYAGDVLPSNSGIGDPYLVASADGKTLYATGLENGRKDSEGKRPNRPVVYRIALPSRTPMEPLFGDAKEAAKDASHLNDPRGLAIDKQGTLLVADFGNDRIVWLDTEKGTLVRELAVPKPRWIGVHGRSGSLLVQSGDDLLTFNRDTKGTFTQTGSIALPEIAERYRGRSRRTFALDSESDPAVLWMGLDRGGAALVRCVEKDGVFGEPQRAEYQDAVRYWNLSVGPDRRSVACKVGHRGLRVLDEETGKVRDLHLTGSSGQTYRLGPNGQVYGMDHWKWGIRRWDSDGKPMPYRATIDDPDRKGRLESVPSGTTAWERDFDVDRKGNLYVKHSGKVYHGRMRIDKYDTEGKRVGTCIWVVSDGALGPRVDLSGNLYVADSIRPVGQNVPDFFKGKLPDVPIDKRSNVEGQYRWMYGSIIKFPPRGGAIWFPQTEDRDAYAFDGKPDLPAGLPKVKVDTSKGDRVATATGELEGALWYQYGCSYLLDMHPGHNRRCHCTATEFEVDDFGRVFFTDQGRFRVVVLDTNGNPITTFGSYGNQDCIGGEGTKPSIPFNWFTGLGVSDRYIYVSDGGNRRVVRVALGYAQERTIDIAN